MRNILFCGLVVVILVSCSTQKAFLERRDEGDYELRVSGTSHFILWGLFNYSGDRKDIIDVSSICGDEEVAWVQSKYEPGDLLFGIVTIGLYAPRSYKVYCKTS